MDCLCQGGRAVITERNSKKGCAFSVDIAETPAQQERGLMFRKKMNDFEGMFFIFGGDEVRYFWMRNTLIPLDIIFIDSSFVIVHVHRNAKPLDETLISSRKPARYVLEINAGKADACRIEPGGRVRFTRSPAGQ